MTWQRVAQWRATARYFARDDLAHETPRAFGRSSALYTLRCEGLNRYDLRRVMRAYDAVWRAEGKGK